MYAELILDRVLLNPLPIQTRGRLKGSIIGTRRQLSHCEIVIRNR